MKKMRKGKKMLLILIILILIVLAVVLIANVINKKPQEKPGPIIEEVQPVIPLPDTTYSNMEVTSIHMQYLKDQDRTMLNFEIKNTTENVVVNENFDAILMTEDGTILGEMPTWLDKLEVGEECDMSVILDGDLTGTTKIKLVKK